MLPAKRQHTVSPTPAQRHGAHPTVAQHVPLEGLGLVPECQCRQGYVTLQAYCAQDGLLGVMFARLGVELRVRAGVGGVDGHCGDGWYTCCRIGSHRSRIAPYPSSAQLHMSFNAYESIQSYVLSANERHRKTLFALQPIYVYDTVD